MKRTTIVILIIAVIGIAFYFGYLKSQNKPGKELRTELRTFETNQPIHLEYQRDPATIPGFVISGNNATMNIKGTLHLEGLINNLFLNDKTVSWSSYYFEVAPEVGRRLYQINLSFPTGEPALNVIETLGKELGFSTFVGETTMQFYRAVRNDKPILFPQSTSKNMRGEGTDNRYRFTGLDFNNVFRHYKSYGILIEDATGVTDKFDGEVMIDKNNPEAMKTDLKTKSGIDLIPFDKTIKLIKIY